VRSGVKQKLLNLARFCDSVPLFYGPPKKGKRARQGRLSDLRNKRLCEKLWAKQKGVLMELESRGNRASRIDSFSSIESSHQDGNDRADHGQKAEAERV
jgi:hypothetical protein